ncbi:ABC transporter permease [Vagococcus vulneris]|uniref:ABC transporter permease n=1 Tax=Vagococcus vulneris TaxID=1977869 RepID=A0A429ZXC1_9ENTE|nr:ABC transporter permease [Vagococcus vulneris]RST98539.1 hypothetical protein CBF37_07120 [Vagococcus vulneris]
MTEFYQLRLKRHQTKMMKYMKYIFNDHFILILMFAVGGCGLYYSDMIKTLTVDQSMFIKVVVALIWLLTLLLGHLATLLQEADQVFLLPKERQMKEYLKKAINYSMVFPSIVLIVLVGITMPLLVVVELAGSVQFLMYLVMLITLKRIDLQLKLQFLYQQDDQQWTVRRLLWLAVTVCCILLSLFVQPVIGLVLALIYLLINDNMTKQAIKSGTLMWEKGCQIEKKRMKQMYTFINLFTDVPGLTSEVKRRAYLDKWLNRIPKTQANVYRYLYARVFLRGTEYSGLVIRLMVVGGLIMAFSSELWISALISVLFLYLIGFQLVPIVGEFDYMLLAQLYPVSAKLKTNAVEQLIAKILGFVSLIFAVISLITLSNKLDALMIIAALAIEWLLLYKSYIPHRLKKIQKMSF